MTLCHVHHPRIGRASKLLIDDICRRARPLDAYLLCVLNGEQSKRGRFCCGVQLVSMQRADCWAAAQTIESHDPNSTTQIYGFQTREWGQELSANHPKFVMSGAWSRYQSIAKLPCGNFSSSEVLIILVQRSWLLKEVMNLFWLIFRGYGRRCNEFGMDGKE